MTHKNVLFRSQAREKILQGATQLADAVRVTLGPRSKSVLIEKQWGAPIVCNDGVTIAKEFDLKDPEENLGARMLREAAERTGEMVGDGTSTATVLAHAILADGIRNVVAGASAIEIKRGLDRATRRAVARLKEISRPVETTLEKQHVATISAHNGFGIGALVGEAKLQDIAVLTGAQVVSEELGLLLKNVTPDRLGKAAKVVVNKDTTTIIGGAGVQKDIHARVAQIRREIDDTTSDYDREKLQERLAKLSGGVAVIRAGAPTEAEMKSKKEALDDAINATKAAVAEGIVPGGGLALLRCEPAVAEEEAAAEGDERTGIRILRRALEAPARQIAENSAVDGGVVVARMLASQGNEGFDASAKEYVDLVAVGIIDPTKVVRTALENAVSVASVLLLTEATMTDIPEPEPRRAAEQTLGF